MEKKPSDTRNIHFKAFYNMNDFHLRQLVAIIVQSSESNIIKIKCVFDKKIKNEIDILRRFDNQFGRSISLLESFIS